MTQVSIKQAQQQLGDLIAAAERGEEVVIQSDNHRSVRLVPVPNGHSRRKAGSARGKITMADDFDAPLEDFREYM